MSKPGGDLHSGISSGEPEGLHERHRHVAARSSTGSGTENVRTCGPPIRGEITRSHVWTRRLKKNMREHIVEVRSLLQ